MTTTVVLSVTHCLLLDPAQCGIRPLLTCLTDPPSAAQALILHTAFQALIWFQLPPFTLLFSCTDSQETLKLSYPHMCIHPSKSSWEEASGNTGLITLFNCSLLKVHTALFLLLNYFHCLFSCCHYMVALRMLGTISQGSQLLGFGTHNSGSSQVTIKAVKAFSVQTHGFFDNKIPPKKPSVCAPAISSQVLLQVSTCLWQGCSG